MSHPVAEVWARAWRDMMLLRITEYHSLNLNHEVYLPEIKITFELR